MKYIRRTALQRLQRFQIENQLYPLGQKPFHIKLLAFVYQVLGRKVIAKMLICTGSCDSCGLCITYCPTKALNLKNKRPYRNKHCKGCLVCAHICPHKAFELPAAYLFGAIALIFLPYDKWFFSLLGIDLKAVLPIILFQIIAFLIWGLAYALVLLIAFKTISLLNRPALTNKTSNISWIKTIRNKINPVLFFPPLIYKQPNLNKSRT